MKFPFRSGEPGRFLSLPSLEVTLHFHGGNLETRSAWDRVAISRSSSTPDEHAAMVNFRGRHMTRCLRLSWTQCTWMSTTLELVGANCPVIRRLSSAGVAPLVCIFRSVLGFLRCLGCAFQQIAKHGAQRVAVARICRSVCFSRLGGSRCLRVIPQIRKVQTSSPIGQFNLHF